MSKNKYKLTIGYDGAPYCGWQIQKSGLSIQFLIEKALHTLLRSEVRCIGASRTDAGVHAKGQVAHFRSEKELSPYKARYSLNALLPPTIRIFDIEPVPPDFHACASAFSKIYYYHLHLDPISNPLTRNYCYRPTGVLNLDQISKAIPHFLGTRDFFSFANEGTKGSASRNAIRTLFRLEMKEQEEGVRLEFEGDGFLYKMVRNITGTLLEVGKGNLDPDKIPHLFAERNRKAVGMAASPQGLCLMKVLYNLERIEAKPPLPTS
ncbi:MAG TPA: tRNA pseudouridine(38-40) synthase TruA [Chlamydiales bacterium]|nr:tRNA pseudouridine(38-40) synthase TruA [Chlamydiales bacterium]